MHSSWRAGSASATSRSGLRTYSELRFLEENGVLKYEGKEIDYLEEEGGRITGFECKWAGEKWRVPDAFSSAYPGSQVYLVNHSNVLDYL
jgi:hypothetical protein